MAGITHESPPARNLPRAGWARRAPNSRQGFRRYGGLPAQRSLPFLPAPETLPGRGELTTPDEAKGRGLKSAEVVSVVQNQAPEPGQLGRAKEKRQARRAFREKADGWGADEHRLHRPENRWKSKTREGQASSRGSETKSRGRNVKALKKSAKMKDIRQLTTSSAEAWAFWAVQIEVDPEGYER